MVPFGMHSFSEAHLVDLLSKSLQNKFNTNLIVKEFAGGYGIADLVFAKNFISDKNVVNRLPIDNYYALKSYLQLPANEVFTQKEVMRISGTSKFISGQIIKQLLKGNYISRKSNYFQKIPIEFKNPIKNLVAIEVKLKNWKQGIVQARRYKSYTDECYLAILSNMEKNIDYSYLDRFGIGLILCNEDNGKIWIKKKPTKNEVLSFYEDVMGIFAKELFLSHARLKLA